jgi:dethiobiotin synthetase
LSGRLFFVTGTDTGAGKTVFAALLTRYLHRHGRRVAALKPICSGGRYDARVLRAAAADVLALDEVNPWHFRAALAPLLAARREQKQVRLAAVTAHIRAIRKQFADVIVEGAGGLLSPLGEDFDSRDLITAFRATPIIVCPNRLGAVNQLRLTLATLPRAAARRAQVVFINPPRPNAPSRTNPKLLAEFFDPRRIYQLPWLKQQRPPPTTEMILTKICHTGVQPELISAFTK